MSTTCSKISDDVIDDEQVTTQEQTMSSQQRSVNKLTRSCAIETAEDEVINSELVEFIRSTMGKSVKDRNIILRIETDLIQFIKDESRTSLPFPSMSSYHRMLVHRISTLFELDHNIDPIGNCVVVSKNATRAGKLLSFRFKELLHHHGDGDILQDNDNKKVTIIQREGTNHCKDDAPPPALNKKQKSFEERAEDYHKVRRRIFEDSWTGQQQQKLTKVESFDIATSNHSNHSKKMFGVKSYSFGGYYNNQQQLHQQQYLGFKQDSTSSTGSSGLSPASSGYKSQASFQLDNPTPTPPPNPQQHNNTMQCLPQQQQLMFQQYTALPQQQQQQFFNNTQFQHNNVTVNNKVLWAVTDLASVPNGALVIDPQTGQTMQKIQPIMNEVVYSPPPPPQQTSAQPGVELLQQQFQQLQLLPQQQQQPKFIYIDQQQQQYYNKYYAPHHHHHPTTANHHSNSIQPQLTTYNNLHGNMIQQQYMQQYYNNQQQSQVIMLPQQQQPPQQFIRNNNRNSINRCYRN